ncbi:HEPN domain-containing protein [Cedecea neteri]|uniref:HEPN domain-containing protein n=1 Tax=Cedecea neteri TaxID=158822 RepID=UPI00068BF909|nr:HEPN domain-containing protein [Cedecea neteri]
MYKSIITNHFTEVDRLYHELDKIAPLGDVKSSALRSQFAGFYVVCLAATYENSVRDVLINYADLFHKKFAYQVEKKYEHLNSKIKFNDLNTIISHFGGNSKWFSKKTKCISKNISIEINKSYDQILNWRHAAAHANKCTTSLEDAFKNHSYSKYVIYAFEESLLGYVRHQNLINAFTLCRQCKDINSATRVFFDQIEDQPFPVGILDIINDEVTSILQKDRREIEKPETAIDIVQKAAALLEKAKQINTKVKKVA